MNRKMANSDQARIDIAAQGAGYKISESGLASCENSFNLDEEFEEERIDGQAFKARAHLDGQCLTLVRVEEEEAVVVSMTVSEEAMEITYRCRNVTAARNFDRIS